jgi:sec-independent protein translocase protein TatA
MGALQPIHLLVVLVVVLIVFGAGRLPEVFGQVGKGVRDFRAEVERPKPATPPTTCAKCGAAQMTDAKFCPRCGAAVAAGSGDT